MHYLRRFSLTIRGVLIEAAYRRLGKVSISPNGLDRILERVKGLWRELPPSATPGSVGAVDGSRNRKEFSGYVVYAVGAASVTFNGGKPSGVEIDADVDLLKPSEYSDSRLRILMGILEFKRALAVLPEVSLLILDGSVIGALIRPPSFYHEVSGNGEIREEMWKLFEKIEEIYSTDRINAKDFYNEIQKKFSGRDYAVAAGFLEYLEYLYTIYLLLKEVRENGKCLVAVSKKSDSRLHFLDTLLPDAAVLNFLNLPPGYLEPKYGKRVDEEKKFKYPGKFDDLLRTFEFTVSFVKLKDQVNKVEVLELPEGDGRFEEVLGYLNFYSVSGYPYPLIEVHKSVKITSEDIEEVIRILKLRGITGREPLGE